MGFDGQTDADTARPSMGWLMSPVISDGWVGLPCCHSENGVADRRELVVDT